MNDKRDPFEVIQAAADQLEETYRRIILPYLSKLDFHMIQDEIPEDTRVHILNKAHDRIVGGG